MFATQAGFIIALQLFATHRATGQWNSRCPDALQTYGSRGILGHLGTTNRTLGFARWPLVLQFREFGFPDDHAVGRIRYGVSLPYSPIQHESAVYLVVQVAIGFRHDNQFPGYYFPIRQHDGVAIWPQEIGAAVDSVTAFRRLGLFAFGPQINGFKYFDFVGHVHKLNHWHQLCHLLIAVPKLSVLLLKAS